MMLTYDPEADAMYVSFVRRHDGDVARTIELGDDRQADYGEDGTLLGVEFLGVSAGLNLDGVPREDDIRRIVAGLPRVSVSPGA